MRHARSILAWIVLALYWPAMFLSTHVAPARLPKIEVFGRDITLHFTAYLILTLLFWLARYGTLKPQFHKPQLYLTLLIMAIYAAVDELSQTAVNRQCDLIDWLSDVAGAFTALMLLILVRKWVYWLILYGSTMFLLSHWPQSQTPFLKLPPFWQQFEIAFVMFSYSILTFLFWQTISKAKHFVINRRILVSTLVAMVGIAFLDETINVLMGRPFCVSDIYAALAGIALAVICLGALARHHQVNSPPATSPTNTDRNS